MLKPVTYAALGIALFVGAAVLLSTVQHDAVAAASNAPAVREPGLAGRHRVLAGETLFSIARAYYGDATKWPLIANANGLTSPQSLRAGDLIAIPTLAGLGVAARESQPAGLIRQFLLRTGAGRDALATIVSDEQGASIRLFVRANGGAFDPLGAEFPKIAGKLEAAWVSDIDGDGIDEVNTIWGADGGGYLSRIFRQSPVGLVLARETDAYPAVPGAEWDSGLPRAPQG